MVCESTHTAAPLRPWLLARAPTGHCTQLAHQGLPVPSPEEGPGRRQGGGYLSASAQPGQGSESTNSSQQVSLLSHTQLPETSHETRLGRRRNQYQNLRQRTGVGGKGAGTRPTRLGHSGLVAEGQPRKAMSSKSPCPELSGLAARGGWGVLRGPLE